MIDCKHLGATHEPGQKPWCPDCGAIRVLRPGGWAVWVLPKLAETVGFDPERRTIACPTCAKPALVTSYEAQREDPGAMWVHTLTVACEHCGQVRLLSRETRAREVRLQALKAVEEAEEELKRARRRLVELEQNGF